MLAAHNLPPSCCRKYKTHLFGNLVTVKKMHSLSGAPWLFQTASSSRGKSRFVFWHGGRATMGTNLSTPALTWEPLPGCSQLVCWMLRMSHRCCNHGAVCLSLRREWSCWADSDEGMGAPFPTVRSPCWHICSSSSSQQHQKHLCACCSPVTTSTLHLQMWSCFCLISWQQTFPVKPPLREHIWGRHVYFRHTIKWKLCWYKGSSALELLTCEVRHPCKLPLQSSGYCDAVTVWLCLHTGAKQSPKEVRCSVCSGSAWGWMTFRNPFQPFFFSSSSQQNLRGWRKNI